MRKIDMGFYIKQYANVHQCEVCEHKFILINIERGKYPKDIVPIFCPMCGSSRHPTWFYKDDMIIKEK